MKLEILKSTIWKASKYNMAFSGYKFITKHISRIDHFKNEFNPRSMKNLHNFPHLYMK